MSFGSIACADPHQSASSIALVETGLSAGFIRYSSHGPDNLCTVDSKADGNKKVGLPVCNAGAKDSRRGGESRGGTARGVRLEAEGQSGPVHILLFT